MLIDQCGLGRDHLAGRVAVVTGAGQGIGREAALILARLGATVIIAELNPTGAETEADIRAAGGRAQFVQTDLADPAAVDHLVQEVQQAFGTPDIVINNAAAISTKPLLELSMAQWDRVMAVNLRSAFLFVKAFLPGMLARRSGTFVTMQSSDGQPYLAPYLASKVGLRSLAASLAQEVGDDAGVDVYCFGPGVVATPGATAAFDDLAQRYGLPNRDAFIKQTGMPLMSAELAATGLVGTVLHAHDFHGQDCFTSHGLSLLGLAADGELLAAAPPITVATPVIPVAAPADTAADGTQAQLGHLADLSRRTEDVLRDNIREYADLSVFQRPVIKRMFQSATGLRVEEWLAQAEAMTAKLSGVAAAGSLTASIPAAQLTAYIAQLRRMVTYFVKQEADARGWFKDPAKLALALTTLKERQAAFADLADALTAALKP